MNTKNRTKDRQLAGAGGVVSIHAIGGMAGIGKTAFAVHAAHRPRRRTSGESVTALARHLGIGCSTLYLARPAGVRARRRNARCRCHGPGPLSGLGIGRPVCPGPVRFRSGAEVRVTCVNRLGELERAIMDVLWDSTEPLTVRQVGLHLTNRDLAHTTVMTVLDRLAKKGFARRQRDGRAWRYQAAANREAYVTELMLHALDQTGDRSAALASFARRVSDSEAEVLRQALESIGELPQD